MTFENNNYFKPTLEEVNEDIELANFLQDECCDDDSICVLSELQKIRAKYMFCFKGVGRKAYYSIDLVIAKHLGINTRIYENRLRCYST